MLQHDDILYFIKQIKKSSWLKNDECRDRLNKMLCELGRHSYEFTKIVNSGVLLTCFYCEAQQISFTKGIKCVECGALVEEARKIYASPTCYKCLPPPPPLPILKED